jgi:hypothetical protein
MTTPPDHGGCNPTQPDRAIALTYRNATQRDAGRRNRQALRARGQGFESPKPHVSAVQKPISILKMIFDLLHCSEFAVTLQPDPA